MCSVEVTILYSNSLSNMATITSSSLKLLFVRTFLGTNKRILSHKCLNVLEEILQKLAPPTQMQVSFFLAENPLKTSYP